MAIKNSIRPLAIIVISIMGFLLIVSFYADRSQLELTGQEMHKRIQSTEYVVSEAQLADLELPVFLDLRTVEKYRQGHREGAVNIPMAALLEKTNREIFQTDNAKVIYSDDLVNAHEAWMLLTQLGYTNLYVLK